MYPMFHTAQSHPSLLQQPQPIHPPNPGSLLHRFGVATCQHFNLTTSQFQPLHQIYNQNRVVSHPHTQFTHPCPSQNPNFYNSLHISHCATISPPHCPTFNIPNPTFRIYYNNKFIRKVLTNTPKWSPTAFDLRRLSPSVLVLYCVARVAPFVSRHRLLTL